MRVKYIGIGLCGLLFGLLFMKRELSYADSTGETTTAKPLISRQTTMTPNISIAISPRIDVEIVPTSAGVFNKAVSRLNVSTNNSSGYKIMIHSKDGSNLKSTSMSNTAEITAVSQAVTQNSFSNNTWGYSLSEDGLTNDSIYRPISTVMTEVVNKTNIAAESSITYDFAIGVKASTDLPAGAYTNEIVISVIANPKEITGFNDLTFMQDMSSTICNKTQTGTTKQLIDTRDGKSYWVTKLLDDRCWMTQNLDLDITTAGLQAADSDINTDWNQSSQYPPMQTLTYVGGGQGNTSRLSYDFGKWVSAVPLYFRVCGNQQLGPSQCTAAGLVDVSDDANWRPGYTAVAGSWKLSNGTTIDQELVAVKCEQWNGNICIGGQYDEHYLMGNFYDFGSATAGAGILYSNADSPVPSSICPKGWQLPAGSGSGSYANLLGKYGISDQTPSGSVDGKTYHIVKEPLYFVPLGEVGPYSLNGTNYLGFTGSKFRSNYWSAGAWAHVNYAGSLQVNFEDTTGAKILMSGATYRSIAYNIRCVAR